MCTCYLKASVAHQRCTVSDMYRIVFVPLVAQERVQKLKAELLAAESVADASDDASAVGESSDSSYGSKVISGYRAVVGRLLAGCCTVAVWLLTVVEQKLSWLTVHSNHQGGNWFA